MFNLFLFISELLGFVLQFHCFVGLDEYIGLL